MTKSILPSVEENGRSRVRSPAFRRRRLTLEAGPDTNVVTIIVHPTGAQPQNLTPGSASAGVTFRFQLTGDAGRTYAIQSVRRRNPPPGHR